MDATQALIFRLWESACKDAPLRPSAQVVDGQFVLSIKGNRDNWETLCVKSGVPVGATQVIDEATNTLTVTWPSLADHIFGKDGLIAHRYGEGYEVRTAQVQFGRLVQRAIEMGAPAVVEAGTGSGKSFGYAAIAMAMNKTVIISTSNKALQGQLAHKDIPFLQGIFPGKKAVVIVGKNSYACKLKCDSAEVVGGKISNPALRDWYRNTDTGSLEDIPFAVDWKTLADIALDTECGGRHCPLYYSCFYYGARADMKDADIIICNHALLSLNQVTGGMILPKVDVVVVDEAHAFPDYIRSTTGVEFVIPSLQKTIALAHGLVDTSAAEADAMRFEKEVNAYLQGKENTQQIGIETAQVFEWGMNLADSLCELADEISPEDEEDTDAETHKLAERAKRMRNMADKIAQMSANDVDGLVRWLEPSRREEPIKLCAQPSDVSNFIAKIAEAQPTIFCSATLAAPDLSHFMVTCGLPDALQMQAPSPFDYASNALLYVPNGDSPAPNNPEWLLWMVGQMRDLVLASKGGAFLLFTSYNALNVAVQELRYTFVSRGIDVFVQGEMPKLELAKRFRENGNAVLFATKSFFEGVSIDGQALRLVVIDKMPFSSPSPLSAAMEADATERARKAGVTGRALEMYAFNHQRVPEMIIELKQGAGRLIRTQTDKGVMAVLDPRIRSAQYGRNQVLPALPPAQLVSTQAKVQLFFGTLAPYMPKEKKVVTQVTAPVIELAALDELPF